MRNGAFFPRSSSRCPGWGVGLRASAPSSCLCVGEAAVFFGTCLALLGGASRTRCCLSGRDWPSGSPWLSASPFCFSSSWALYHLPAFHLSSPPAGPGGTGGALLACGEQRDSDPGQLCSRAGYGGLPALPLQAPASSPWTTACPGLGGLTRHPLPSRPSLSTSEDWALSVRLQRRTQQQRR